MTVWREDDVSIAHQHFACPAHHGIPDRLGSDSALNQIDGSVSGFFIRAFTENGKHLDRRPGIDAARSPIRPKPASEPLIASRRTVDTIVAAKRVAAFARQDRIGQGAEYRLAVLPANRVQVCYALAT